MKLKRIAVLNQYGTTEEINELIEYLSKKYHTVKASGGIYIEDKK